MAFFTMEVSYKSQKIISIEKALKMLHKVTL